MADLPECMVAVGAAVVVAAEVGAVVVAAVAVEAGSRFCANLDRPRFVR
jgi:hypothetical protein